MDVCNKEHRYADYFDKLPQAQGDEGRHKCAGCAYELGFEAGLNNHNSNYGGIIQTLRYSQAGTVRHKDTEAAYGLGYTDGKAKYLKKSEDT